MFGAAFNKFRIKRRAGAFSLIVDLLFVYCCYFSICMGLSAWVPQLVEGARTGTLGSYEVLGASETRNFSTWVGTMFKDGLPLRLVWCANAIRRIAWLFSLRCLIIATLFLIDVDDQLCPSIHKHLVLSRIALKDYSVIPLFIAYYSFLVNYLLRYF